MKNNLGLVLVSSFSLVALGCAEQTEPKVPTASAADIGATRPTGPAPAADDASSITLSERLRKLCSIDTALFAFDSANLDKAAQGALDQLAGCFTTGPAKGKRMSLVGHADERGEETYNMGLGQRRAGSVATYLKKRGVPNDDMETSSRGELDATGRDDDGWSRDRRVAIDLAGE